MALTVSEANAVNRVANYVLGLNRRPADDALEALVVLIRAAAKTLKAGLTEAEARQAWERGKEIEAGLAAALALPPALTHDEVDTARYTDDDTGTDRYALVAKASGERLLEFATLDDALGIAIDLLIECRAGAAELQDAQRLAGGE